MTQCLKITEKVSFYITSIWKSEAYGQTVLPDKSILISILLLKSDLSGNSVWLQA